MADSIDGITAQLMGLPREARERLAEQIMVSIVGDVDPAVERSHLDAAKRRRDEIRSGTVQSVSAEEAEARIAAILDR